MPSCLCLKTLCERDSFAAIDFLRILKCVDGDLQLPRKWKVEKRKRNCLFERKSVNECLYWREKWECRTQVPVALSFFFRSLIEWFQRCANVECNGEGLDLTLDTHSRATVQRSNFSRCNHIMINGKKHIFFSVSRGTREMCNQLVNDVMMMTVTEFEFQCKFESNICQWISSSIQLQIDFDGEIQFYFLIKVGLLPSHLAHNKLSEANAISFSVHVCHEQ